MPLLAAFIGTIASGMIAVLSRFLAFDLALKLASYTAWITVFSLFLTAVFVCMSGLLAGINSMFAAGAALTTIKAGFGMGLGMLIPANAATVIGCMSSVWIACQIYKVQREGMHNYSK